MEHQFHFGKRFYLDKKTGYWISSNCPKIRAHRWVWQNLKGDIPKGYHIHHIDDNKSNNDISNLEMILAHDHLSLHSSKPENRERASKNCDRIRPLTKAWHGSKEGLEWHRKHAIQCNFGNGPLHEYQCQQCTKVYYSKLVAESRTRFCSNKCKSQWRRLSGLDDIEKTCVICKKKYIQNKYARSKTCGRICGRLFKNKIN